MPGEIDSDAVDLEVLGRAAARWEEEADGLRAAARAWATLAGPPGVAEFAARAAATLAGHAEAASAAAERLRAYCAAVRSTDEEGSRSVRCAIQAATSMSATPIADVTVTPASNA